MGASINVIFYSDDLTLGVEVKGSADVDCKGVGVMGSGQKNVGSQGSSKDTSGGNPDWVALDSGLLTTVENNGRADVVKKEQ